MKKTIFVFLVLGKLVFSQGTLYDYTNEPFINIRRIIPSSDCLFVLNETKKSCFSKVSINDVTLKKQIVRYGNGPNELVYPMDMDLYENRIIIANRYGDYFLYDIKTEKLSEKFKIPYKKKYGLIHKISFIGRNKVLISFCITNSNATNIENNLIKHWIIFNLKSREIAEIGIPRQDIKNINKLNTFLFFTHGILENGNIILTIHGLDDLYIYNINKNQIIKKINVKHDNYFFFKKVESKIYGKGVKTAATFMDKGMKYQSSIIFISGGIDPIKPQLIRITNDFRLIKYDLILNDYFKGNISLNGSIYTNSLLYWENWPLVPRSSASFVTQDITNLIKIK